MKINHLDHYHVQAPQDQTQELQPFLQKKSKQEQSKERASLDANYLQSFNSPKSLKPRPNYSFGIDKENRFDDFNRRHLNSPNKITPTPFKHDQSTTEPQQHAYLQIVQHQQQNVDRSSIKINIQNKNIDPKNFYLHQKVKSDFFQPPVNYEQSQFIQQIKSNPFQVHSMNLLFKDQIKNQTQYQNYFSLHQNDLKYSKQIRSRTPVNYDKQLKNDIKRQHSQEPDKQSELQSMITSVSVGQNQKPFGLKYITSQSKTTTEFYNYSQNKSQNIYYISKVIDSIFQKKNYNVQDHFNQILNSLHLMKNKPKPTQEQVNGKKIYLPISEKNRGTIAFTTVDKKTIIFDLDETLIHCVEQDYMKSDIKISIKLQSGNVANVFCYLFSSQVGINIRPHVQQCLQELSQYFELMVFTASQSAYANQIIDHIDPDQLQRFIYQTKRISHRLYRDNCIFSEEAGVYIKDLRIIVNRNISDMLLVDNASYSFGQLDNGVPILAYYDDKSDQELLHLKQYLKKISNCKDLRETNKQTFKLDQYIKFTEPVELLQNLYLKQ